MLENGEYLITCVSNGRCFDANTQQIQGHPDEEHKRIFLHEKPCTTSQSHWWYVDNVEGSDDAVLLKTNYMQEEAFALDGNCKRYIVQMGKKSKLSNLFSSGDNLTPYLWHAVRHAKNHQWKLVPASDSTLKNVFCIVNVESNKCLNGDMSEEKIWTPRMINFDEKCRSTSGLLWRFDKCIETNDPLPAPAHYMLLNRGNGHCLQMHTLLRDAISLNESPMKFDESHDWFVRCVGRDEFTLSLKIFDSEKQLGIDPESHHPDSPSLVAADDTNRNNRWRLAPAIGEKKKFHLLNAGQNKLLIGKPNSDKMPMISNEVDHVFGVWSFVRVTQSE